MTIPTINNIQSFPPSGTPSYTVPSGDDRVLVLVFGAEHNAPGFLTAVSYGGVSMTQAGPTVEHNNGSFSNWCQVWYLINPTVGAANFAFTGAATTNSGWDVDVFTLTDANQSSQPDATQSGTSATSPNDISITTTVADTIVIMGLSQGTNTTMSPTNSATEVDQTSSGSFTLLTVTKDAASTGSVTLGGSGPSWSRSAGLAVSFAPVASGSSVLLPFMMHMGG